MNAATDLVLDEVLLNLLSRSLKPVCPQMCSQRMSPTVYIVLLKSCENLR